MMKFLNVFPREINADGIDIEFHRLLKNNQGLIRYMMQKLDVPRDFWDDYYQEILINLWVGYRENWGRIENLSGFIGEICFRSISAFRRFFTKGANRIISYTDKPYVFDVSDEEYTEPHIEALKNILEVLPEEDQYIIKMILNGQNLTAEAVAQGQRPNYYHRKTAPIYATIRALAPRYFDKTPKHIPRPKRIGKKRTTIQPSAKPVEQYQKDGTFIRRWSSTLEAARATGIGQGNISRSATGSIGLAGGFKWKYVTNGECLEIQTAEALQVAV